MTDNERIAVLETKAENIHRDVGELNGAVKEMHKTLGEMNNMFMQAKGARWAFLAMAAVGGFISAKIVPIAQALGFWKG